MTDLHLSDTVTLGGIPSAIGGVPPYTYSWFTRPYKNPFLKTVNHTEFWLDDSTLANPSLIHFSFETDSVREFILTVTDSLGTMAKDTVRLSICGYYPNPLGNRVLYATVGDTVRIYAYSTFTCKIDSIRWKPRPYIISGLNNWYVDVVVPTVDFRNSKLHASLFSSNGCNPFLSGSDPLIVEVYPLKVEEIGAEHIRVFPNPTSTNMICIEQPGNDPHLQLYNSIGEEVDFSRLGNCIYLPGGGTYLLKVTLEGGAEYSKIILSTDRQ
ncbi:MAG: hypothetical protein Kow0075_05360 [Salibacteraceae bacterium]